MTTSPWNPLFLSPLCWLDASDDSVITVDGGVSQWLDKSGNGRHCGNTLASSRPAVLSANLNGRNVIYFSGNKILRFDAQMLSTRGFDVFFVGYPTAITTDSRIGYGNLVIGDSPGSGTQSIVIGFRIGKFASYGALSSGAYECRALNINPLNAWAICQGYSNTAQTGARINAANLSTAHGSRTDLSIRGIGGSGESTLYSGRLAELFVFDGVIGSEDQINLEGYLASKWGLQSLLPQNHKWKTLAPTVPNWEGVAKFSDDAIAEKIHITNATTGRWIATATPDQASGTFTVPQVAPQPVFVTIFRAGYRPLTHGPIEPILLAAP